MTNASFRELMWNLRDIPRDDSSGDVEPAGSGVARHNSNYTIGRQFFVCFDKQNPLVRAGQMESKPIPGTMSHYCYSAVSLQGKMQVRKYSCYCGSCSDKKWDRCIFVDIIRTDHPKLLPQKWKRNMAMCAVYNRAMRTGWVEYMMAITEDLTLRGTRSASSKTREVYASALRVGSIIPVYTQGQGMVADHSYFWLAIVRSKGKKRTTKVTFKAIDTDKNWDIKKGQTVVLNVQWLERRPDDQRLFDSNGEMQTIALESVLTHKITEWEDTNASGKKKATLMRLKLEDEKACVDLCRAVKVTKSHWEAKSDDESGKSKGGSDSNNESESGTESEGDSKNGTGATKRKDTSARQTKNNATSSNRRAKSQVVNFQRI